MTKAELRKAYKQLRKHLSEEQIETLSLQIANQLLTLPIWDREFYHLFLSITEHNEVNTEYILNILSGKDKNIIISKSNFSTLEMSHYLLTDATKIKKNKWNIPEPVDGIPINTSLIDVVFIPLLAFDNTGHRVGYGKGFYDAFLATCKPETLKIGLSFFQSSEQEISDVSKTDVKLDYCVVPDKIYTFP
ncbi:5-formyltetrahydrofolate cyclo-ligase [uncultured Psychroserpens sp.]|uniref:5-formyltetrahydrofolate cyclo-ligase n=1 Tax=uncultured Psychroserpens sp. TaxID=255436 RepID=UPI002636B6CF|nr:5-formyltetrahydrofolate cyclo-ligase [uncultured Psychroserpens sp.]